MSFYNQVNRLPNMEDTSQESINLTNTILRKFNNFMALNGYRSADTPILEKADLFLRKSGGAISSRLYQFNDPGGFETCLRPEFTSAIIRYALSDPDVMVPARICYFGPVFRYSKPGETFSDLPRQFNQYGAEFVGSDSFIADSEIVSLAYNSLKKVISKQVNIVIGDVGIIWLIANHFDLSDLAKMFLLEKIKDIKSSGKNSVLDQAVQLGLISKKDENIPIEKEDSLENSVKKLKNLSQSFEFVTNSYTRTQEDIIKRLINKSNGSDKISSFKGALNLIAETINIRGNIGEAVKDLKGLWKDHKLPSKKILMLEELVSLISAMGVPKKQITVDLGLVRDVGYYSGMVFDIKAGSGNEIIGGGGRYDGLSKDLGFKDIPARGFAFDFNKIMNISNISLEKKEPIIIRPSGSSATLEMIKYSEFLRMKGISCEIDYTGISSSENRQVLYINSSGDVVEE